jgi:hypothetical protein
MNIEIANDISQRNIIDSPKESTENSLQNTSDMKRKLLGRKTKRNYSSIPEIEKTRCDICLEYEKYSENKLIECFKCAGICHKRCGENDICFINKLKSIENLNTDINDEEWECIRCRNSNSFAPLDSQK